MKKNGWIIPLNNAYCDLIKGQSLFVVKPHGINRHNCILINASVCLLHVYRCFFDFSLHFQTALHCPALSDKMAVSANEPGTFMLASVVAAVLIYVWEEKCKKKAPWMCLSVLSH